MRAFGFGLIYFMLDGKMVSMVDLQSELKACILPPLEVINRGR